jgi:two-component system, NtrC family, sensor kinase
MVHPPWVFSVLGAFSRFARRDVQTRPKNPRILPRREVAAMKLSNKLSLGMSAAVFICTALGIYLQNRIGSPGMAMAAFLGAALCGLGSAAFSAWFVERPIRALINKARRVGAGDHSGPILIPSHDDITELAHEMNAMCERLADAQEQIQVEAEARIATLEQLRHADRLKTVGQLAAGVAHELGTPLNVVAGRAKMISDGDSSPEEILTHARIIGEQAERMTTIIRQLLGFARRKGPRFGIGELYSIAKETSAMLSPLADKHKVSLALDKEVRISVEVDPNQIQQAVSNLMVNAIEASPGKQVTVRVFVRKAQPPADHGGSAGEYACLVVEDEGRGIPKKQLPHIFEPFFTTKAVGEGTGLGLSVSHDIVREHGGWIEVESEVDKGSRFSLFLPLVTHKRTPSRPFIGLKAV